MAAVINMAEGAAPSTPAAGTHNLYVDTDGDWHILDDGGNDHTLATTAIELGTANVADDAITTAKIDDEAVTNAKLAQMDEATIKGRAASAGTGAPVDLTVAQVAAILAGYLGGGTTDANWTSVSSLGSYWTAPLTGAYPYATSWGGVAYRLVNGIVYVKGTVKCTTTTSAAVFTLPEGYRPVARQAFAIAAATNSNNIARIAWVDDDGDVYIPSPSTLEYFHLCFSFVPVPA